MANFFKASKKAPSKLPEPCVLTVTANDNLGQGIAKHNQKTVFIDGAITGEEVKVRFTHQKRDVLFAKAEKIITGSPLRCEPQCRYFEQCGGCDQQHINHEGQLALKEQVFLNSVNRITHVKQLEPTIVSNGWHYRRKARLACFFDKKQKTLNLGFRAKGDKTIVAIDACPVLTSTLSGLIEPLQRLLEGLHLASNLGHVELIEDDSTAFVVLRVVAPINRSDREQLQAFATHHQIVVAIQDNHGKITNIADETSVQGCFELLSLEAIHFGLGQFIQVNRHVNQQMVAQAIDWLNPSQDDVVLDLFCGGGNFSIALANRSKQLIGVEGVAEMVDQASHNAQLNKLTNCQFVHADLSDKRVFTQLLTGVDKVLLDPARAGAQTAVQWLSEQKISQILYVSCDAQSFVRDAKILVSSGYKMEKIGLMDMFAQTHKTESMALFIR